MILERAMNGRVKIRCRQSRIEGGGSILIRLLLGVDVRLVLHLSRRVVAVLRVEIRRRSVLWVLHRLLLELRRRRSWIGSKRIRSRCSGLSGELLLMGDDGGEIEIGRVIRRDELLLRVSVIGVGEWLVAVEMLGVRFDGGHGRASGTIRQCGIDDGGFLRLLDSSIRHDLPIDHDDGFGVAMLLRVFRGVNP